MAAVEQFVCTGVNWIDINDPSLQEMQELSARYGRNERSVRDCLQPEQLPK